MSPVFLAATLALAAGLPAQATQTATGSYAPIGVPWPTFTCTLSCTGTSTTTNGTVSVPQYGGPGTVTAITVALGTVLGGSYAGQLSNQGFVGVTADLGWTCTLTVPGAGTVGANTKSVTTVNSNQALFVGFALNTGYGGAGPIAVPASAFGTYLGSGQVSMRIHNVFDQRVYPSQGSITGAYALGQNNTVATVTVTYTVCTGTPASAVGYGAGCMGTGGLMPQIAATGLPQLGNTAFAVDLSGARPASTAALLLSAGSANQSLGSSPCTLLLANPLVSAPPLVTTPGGTASQPLPVPADPATIGMHVYAQFLVSDPGGALAGVFALSGGLDLTVGC